MGWFGTALGAGIGFMFGGPLGAVIGATAGHFGVDDRNASSVESRQAAYFGTLFCCLAKMAKADGHVSKSEIRVVEDFITNVLKFDGETRKFAIDVFTAARDDSTPAEEYIKQFAEIIQYNQDVGSSFLTVLHQIALADGVLGPNEISILRTAEFHLRLARGTVDSLIGTSSVGDIEKSYKVLECTPDMSDAQIKSAYRESCKKFHPDYLQSKGLPPEFISFANDQMVKIRQAYENINEHRNM